MIAEQTGDQPIPHGQSEGKKHNQTYNSPKTTPFLVRGWFAAELALNVFFVIEGLLRDPKVSWRLCLLRPPSVLVRAAVRTRARTPWNIRSAVRAILGRFHGIFVNPFDPQFNAFLHARLSKVLARKRRIGILKRGLSDGVTVAQLPLEEFVMVRIHVGQPILLRKR